MVSVAVVLRILELGLELALDVWRSASPEQKQKMLQRWIDDDEARRQDWAAFVAWVTSVGTTLKLND